jgi:dimethylamine/trimethylamine dehydrogenase
VLELGAAHVVLATGAHWRKDGFGRATPVPPIRDAVANIHAPEDIIRGVSPTGTILIYDDERYVMASALALKLLAEGRNVIYATPAPIVSEWTAHTNEQPAIQGRLIKAGARLIFGKALAGFDGQEVELVCLYTGQGERIAADALVPVTAREPERALYEALEARRADWKSAGILSVDLIGDAEAPGLIAHAVYSGHKLAREIERSSRDETVQRDRAA